MIRLLLCLLLPHCGSHGEDVRVSVFAGRMEGGEEENSDELRKEQSQTSGVKIVDFRRDWESSVAMFIVSYQTHYKMHTQRCWL